MAEPSTPSASAASPPGQTPNLLLRLLFAVYKRVLSPALHAIGVSRCIFLPTCSEYAFVALARYGFWRGGGLALRRLARCHPLSKGGLDPVP